MFFHRKKAVSTFDKTGKTPVLRTSICTGEQTAGFKDETTGKFYDIMLIRDHADLREFLETYGVSEDQLRREY